MNYDSVTELPLEASFLAYAQYSLESQNNNHFYILVINFPILKNNAISFNANNKKLLLSTAVEKLIRNHSYMKTAYRDERTDNIVVLLDESLMVNHDVVEELQKAFMCFTSICADRFLGIPVFVHAGVYNIADKKISAMEAIQNAYYALNTITDDVGTHLAFYRESVIDQQKNAMKILPAIENNWKSNNLLIYLQPKFDLKHNTLAGAEALVRIVDTSGHIVKPGFFLPILQKNSMSCEMDLMVVEKILRLLGNWSMVGITLMPISVNLSEKSLYDPMFRTIFSELMEKYSEIQRYLRIEISESHYLRNPYHINQMIDFFHGFGCMVELDDYGKSSMSYTEDTIPNVDFIKISSAFWSMAMQNSKQDEIFTDTVKLINSCNISCICECIENNEELAYIQSHNISFAQGFHFSRPVPFDIFQKKYLSYTFMYI